jgi:hypothetical protein
MTELPLHEALFQGAISLEYGQGYVKPWRLPFRQLGLFPSPGNDLVMRSACPSGVRLRLATTSTVVRLSFQPLGALNAAVLRDAFVFDATIDGALVASGRAAPGATSVELGPLPGGEKVVEVWLPPDTPVALTAVALAAGASWTVPVDTRPRWVTYGSSLTHCVRAHGGARIWSAIVARRHGLHLTSLGYGGQCHQDPLIGMMIRDLPADLITLKLGINSVSGSLNARTYPSAIVGLVRIIREKHPTTPMTLVSPIGYPPNETTPNKVDYTISAMREAMADVHQRLVAAGDRHLYYVNGLEVFSLAQIAQYATDQCHPNADGIELMAEQFDRAVMRPLLGRLNRTA